MNQNLKDTISFGTQYITFSLIYMNRKTLGITVRPDSSVLVKAPFKSDIDKIKSKVKKRAHWIIKQQKYFDSFQPRTPVRKYVSGETHLYLGRRYKLKVIQADYNLVKVYPRIITVFSKEETTSYIKAVLQKWYLEKAKEKILPKIDLWFARFSIPANKDIKIQFRFMANRWGSCSTKGNIILNTDLIRAPLECIEYVIMHELCHLIIPKHNKAFYEMQTKMMAEWPKWKDRLERIMV